MADETKTNATVVADAKEQPEVDYEAQLKAKDEELAKAREISENYRRGMLKAKGKSAEDDDADSEEDRIARIVDKRLKDTQVTKLQQEKDELIAQLARDLKETKVALKNRGQVGTSNAQGGNQDQPEVKTEFWTEAQKADLKRRFDMFPHGKQTFEQFLVNAQKNLQQLKQK